MRAREPESSVLSEPPGRKVVVRAVAIMPEHLRSYIGDLARMRVALVTPQQEGTNTKA